MALTIRSGADRIIVERGQNATEIVLRPFSLTLRRAGRRLLRDAGFWVADGRVDDLFIHLTEGVIAHEELAPRDRALRAVLDRGVPTGWS